MSDSLVIIPTYNEKENIQDIIRAVLSEPDGFSVLVVDDGSPDGTAHLVKDMATKHPNKIFIKERASKLGLGTAYILGFKFALQQGFKYIFEMDADFSHNPKDLTRLRRACAEGADVAIGSRYISKGDVENWSIDRHILSRGASYYVQLLSGMKINDPTAGFICYQSHVLEKLDLDKISFIGYAFQIEMKFAVRSLGFKLVEIPIIFTDRVKGTSKMNLSIVKEGIFGVIQMVRELKKDPKKYFRS